MTNSESNKKSGDKPKRSRKRPKRQKPRILCVDDEPMVLEGLEANLRRTYDVTTAVGGQPALDVMDTEPEFAVIISDMRMPEMNGAQFLGRACQLAPNTVRLLLTGHADLEAAVSAVNEGQIFGYLTKPCPAKDLLTALDDAMEQHRLINAEREVLENTLWGSVNMLGEVLELVNPSAFGRTSRIQDIVGQLARKLRLPNTWQFEVAALLSQIGCVTLPPDTLLKVDSGTPINREERAAYQSHPGVAHKLLEKIPRLEEISQMIGRQMEPYQRQDLAAGTRMPRKAAGGRRPKAARDSKAATEAATPIITDILAEDRVTVGASMLRVAIDMCRLMTGGMSQAEAVEKMTGRKTSYHPDLVGVLPELEVSRSAMIPKALRISALDTDMVLTQDVETRAGVVVVSSGQPVSQIVIERLVRFNRGVGIVEPIHVLVNNPEPETGD